MAELKFKWQLREVTQHINKNRERGIEVAWGLGKAYDGRIYQHEGTRTPVTVRDICLKVKNLREDIIEEKHGDVDVKNLSNTVAWRTHRTQFTRGEKNGENLREAIGNLPFSYSSNNDVRIVD